MYANVFKWYLFMQKNVYFVDFDTAARKPQQTSNARFHVTAPKASNSRKLSSAESLAVNNTSPTTFVNIDDDDTQAAARFRQCFSAAGLKVDQKQTTKNAKEWVQFYKYVHENKHEKELSSPYKIKTLINMFLYFCKHGKEVSTYDWKFNEESVVHNFGEVGHKAPENAYLSDALVPFDHESDMLAVHEQNKREWEEKCRKLGLNSMTGEKLKKTKNKQR